MLFSLDQPVAKTKYRTANISWGFLSSSQFKKRKDNLASSLFVMPRQQNTFSWHLLCSIWFLVTGWSNEKDIRLMQLKFSESSLIVSCIELLYIGNNAFFYRFSLCIPEFKDLTGDEQRILLLQNLDPMFNIKSGFFFQTDRSSGLVEQLEKFSIFDITTLTKYVH